ncbi:unnamed protein product [Chironomus riparius]|uniref:exodeoxyribonuclease III n=1 Tax=Chironomus riparius TaxID=315576 RepID=A0A9N9RSA6_9DIPT|nr:unnamed protein product [Chironomus riparius]
MKIVAWNVSGLRSCVSKGCVEYLLRENADIICLSEVKCRSEEEVPVKMKLRNYHAYWNVEKGMSGVGLLSKLQPLRVSFVCCYVVNAGRGLKTLDKRLEWNKIFDEYIKSLDKKKPVIIAGDLNVAHNEIDLANPQSNHKTAGFTKEEREGFTKFLSYGFIDTFRELYPDQTGAYTFWSYMRNARAKNVGWRLDYFIVSKRFMSKVKDNIIRSSVKGSDHCPIVLYLKV